MFFVFKNTYNNLKNQYEEMLEHGKKTYQEMKHNIDTLSELHREAEEDVTCVLNILSYCTETIEEIVSNVSEHPNGTTRKIIKQLQMLVDGCEDLLGCSASLEAEDTPE